MSGIPDLDVFQCDLDGINLIEASAGTGKTWNICGFWKPENVMHPRLHWPKPWPLGLWRAGTPTAAWVGCAGSWATSTRPPRT